MCNSLLLLSDLTDEDRAKAKAYYERRNLYKKYSENELADWKKVDLYEALDLDGFRYREIPQKLLNEATIRKLSIYHPLRNGSRESAFLLIKKAKTILGNPVYRKLYDSLYLDESIPEDREYSLEEFISVFSDVFRRNGQFSEKQPVPELKDSVDEFYKFWFSFKSTRVYDDPDDVFEQRGWQRRYNAEFKKDALLKAKNADAVRVHGLVKLAYSRDPRIKRAPSKEAPWREAELSSLKKFGVLLGKHKNKFEEISKKLNHLYLTKRTAQEVKAKLEAIKKAK